MKQHTAKLFAALCLGLLSSASFAHHSTSGIYDETKVVEMTGTVVQWRFINPHPSLVLEVTDAKGEKHNWDLSYGGSAVTHLAKRGYSPRSFIPGDVIVVHGNPARLDGAYGLLMRDNPTHVDGSPIIMPPEPAPAAAP